ALPQPVRDAGRGAKRRLRHADADGGRRERLRTGPALLEGALQAPRRRPQAWRREPDADGEVAWRVGPDEPGGGPAAAADLVTADREAPAVRGLAGSHHG